MKVQDVVRMSCLLGILCGFWHMLLFVPSKQEFYTFVWAYLVLAYQEMVSESKDVIGAIRDFIEVMTIQFTELKEVCVLA